MPLFVATAAAQAKDQQAGAKSPELTQSRIEIVGRGSGPVKVITHQGEETQTENIKPRPLNGLSPTVVNRERSAYDSFLAAQQARREQMSEATEESTEPEPIAEETAPAETDEAEEAAQRQEYRKAGLSQLQSKGYMYWLQDGESYPSVVYDSWNGRFLKTEDALETTVGSFESWKEGQSETPGAPSKTP